MTETETLIALIESHAWYPLAAALITLTLRLWTHLPASIVERLPVLPREWQWVPPVVIALAGGFTEAAATGVPLWQALVLAAYAGVSGGMAAIGIHHTAKRIEG